MGCHCRRFRPVGVLPSNVQSAANSAQQVSRGTRSSRSEGERRGARKIMIVALAHKLLIALWRMVTTWEVPADVLLHPAR